MALDLTKYLTQEQITGSVKNRQADWANEALQIGLSISASLATEPSFDSAPLVAEIAKRESWIATADAELASLFPVTAQPVALAVVPNGDASEEIPI